MPYRWKEKKRQDNPTFHGLTDKEWQQGRLSEQAETVLKFALANETDASQT
jgi:hypothetical protein